MSALRKFAAPWFELPADITGDGKVKLEGTLGRCRRRHWWPTPALTLEGVDLTNEASTIVTDKLAGDGAPAHANRRAPIPRLALEVRGTQGQVLVNPMLLDFGANPLAAAS